MGNKCYKIKVTLYKFARTIKRTMLINDNVKIKDFCESIIISMNGDLSHLYTLEYKDNIYIMDMMDIDSYKEIKMGTKRLSKLLLEEKDKLILNYDFGDDWIFQITINKVLDEHNDKDITIIDGIGKGIVEDCGGVYGLSYLINSKSSEWNEEFDINKVNKRLEDYFR